MKYENHMMLLNALDKLNQAVGTPKVDEAKRAVKKLLPEGLRLSFCSFTNDFFIVKRPCVSPM